MAIPATVERYLATHGAHFSTVHHPRAYTAQEEAAVAHVRGREWAKTVICFANDEPIQAVLPADLVVDQERLRALAGARTLRLAEEREFVELYPDCERGATPPLGPMFGQRVYVDAHLAEDPEIVFSGGTHTDAVRMRYSDYHALVHPVVGDFCAGRPEGPRLGR